MTEGPQEPQERLQIVGYGGKVHDAPRRPWFAATDAQGNLVRDEAGRPVRVRVRYSGA